MGDDLNLEDPQAAVGDGRSNMQRFLAWARRARGKPTFDLEEREHRLTAARTLRHILDAAADGSDLGGPVGSLYGYLRPRHPLVNNPQLRRIKAWVDQDQESFRHAVEPFLAELEPADRIDKLDRAVAAAPVAHDEAFVVALGSLLNFAVAPSRLPIIRAGAFGRLEQLLDRSAPSRRSASDQYAHHLAFATWIDSELAAAGVSVRDMIDTESLIAITSQDHEFWSSDSDESDSDSRRREPEIYLAAAAMYRDEAPYLAEWLEFHRLVGVERFYLYDNGSSDHHREVLEPYVAEGLVALHDWPGSPGQFQAYDHCLASHGEEARWIAFIDLDEFLFSPTYEQLPNVLGQYEQWPGVVVNVARFGTSGHRTRPDGLVLENYLVHLRLDSDRTVKSIVDPIATRRCLSSHQFEFHRRTAVDENGYPVWETASKSATFERLCVNHYYTKSVEELVAKHELRRTAEYPWHRRPLPPLSELESLEAAVGERDETILHYVPPLRRALANRVARRQRENDCTQT
jgi:Glycosyltransferase family 92